MWKNYLKLALRNLLWQRGYTLINLAGLAGGLACSFFILLWVQDELSHDRFFEDGDRVHRVWRNVNVGDRVHTWSATPKPLADVLRTEYPEIVRAVPTVEDFPVVITQGERSFRESGSYASEAFFDLFPFPFIQGDPTTALTGESSAVITARTARKLFGEDWQTSGDVLGQRLTVAHREDFTITGVIEDLPANSSWQFDVLLPIHNFFARSPWVEEWGANGFRLYVKLREGASAEAVSEKITGVVMAHEEGADETLFLQPYKDLYLHSDYENGQLVGGRIEYVRIFSAVAVFLLLIACVNFMNLATARSAKRAREVGVRKAVGAGRRALAGQFLGESVLLALLAFVLALGLVLALLPFFNGLTSKSFARADLGARFLLGGLGIAFVVGLVAGSYPAFYLASFNPLAVLRGTLRQRPGAARLRKGLVVFQFGLSTLLVVATVAAHLQVRFIHERDIGLERDNLIYLEQEGALESQHGAVRQELLARPGIASVTAANANPLEIRQSTGGATWAGKDPDDEREVYVINADYDFVETMQMRLVTGRTFSRAFGADTAGFVINEEMAEALGGSSVVGKKIEFWGLEGAVLGVVEDFDMNSLHAPTEPVVIRLAPEETSRLYVRAEPGQTAEALASLEAVFEAFNPEYPFDYRFLDEAFEAAYRSEVVVGRLANVFAVVAIFISCLGLFGLVSYTAERRTKEIGVRKVLGASVPSLVVLLTGEVTKLVLLGIALALPVAYYVVHQWLAGFEHHVDVGAGLFVATGLLAVVIAWLTSSYQAVRAAMADPVRSLRHE